ncbi:hypothetical protein [Aureispira anguillae]|uniref:Uncharacterized protein n=1 Tax=Aureispira anguillae TaxID=2864201 RepID=A0A915YHV2_9BACT|nr:hypothetical protein [Aureispira anguillae]BDS13468.1 hypothetical protein AsAng_0042060 [Aureispira anguillae]
MDQPSTFNTKLFFTSLFCLFITCFCFGQIKKKAYETIVTDNVEVVRVNIQGASVVFKETKGTRILVETSIKLSVPNPALLSFVIERGRYKLMQTRESSTRELILESKKNKNAILVKGELCAEEVAYTIYIPTHIRSFKH